MIKTSGWLILACLGCALLTGGLLTWYYVPTEALAFRSVQTLEASYVFGAFLRALHYFSSHFCLALTLLHFVAVLIETPATTFSPARWGSGLMSLLLLVVLGFSGKILPWDQHGGVSLIMASALFRLGPADPISTLLGSSMQVLMRVLVLHVMGTALLVYFLTRHFSLLAAWSEKIAWWRKPRAMLSMGGILVLLLICSLIWRAPLTRSFSLQVSTSTVSAEWYLRALQWLSLRGTWATGGALLSLILLGAGTRYWPLGKTSPWRMIWRIVLGVLTILSLWPLSISGVR
jgi:quinol-cytochrome oxidoreductase complex cytochrome b subunit